MTAFPNKQRFPFVRMLSLIFLTLGTGACSTEIYQTKPSVIDQNAADHITLGQNGYRRSSFADKAVAPDLLLLLTFSGGGKRSAAFSYGVLRGLRDTPVQSGDGQRRLLDAVDGIGSVSGGTFTAAYYGLYRDKIFTDYVEGFLKEDIDSYIWGTYLLPWNWAWMVHPRYGTNDRMQSVYDDLLFHGATYRDVIKNGLPLVWIGATDISYGSVFTFNQDTFDVLCVDLPDFPIARAVAASNGFPVLFSPINLENHADHCGGWRPNWVQQHEREDEDTMLRRQVLADNVEAYLNVSASRYVHLSDGGISDNLALRGLLNQIIELEDDVKFQTAAGLAHVRRLLLISADGQSAQDTSIARDETVSGLGRIINAVTGTQIDRYNFETLSLARREITQSVEKLKKLRCGISRTIDGYPCDDVEGYLVHLSLGNIQDPQERERLEQIPTGLTIPDEDVEALITAGEAQVKSSAPIAKVVRSLAPRPQTSPAVSLDHMGSIAAAPAQVFSVGKQ